MSKPGVKKTHWTSRVNECAVIKDARGDLNVSLLGGAENGEFAVIGPINESLVIYKNGRLNEGELLLEVENLSIDREKEKKKSSLSMGLSSHPMKADSWSRSPISASDSSLSMLSSDRPLRSSPMYMRNEEDELMDSALTGKFDPN